jgi:coenzyme F420 hydrogenase subunit beta
MIQSSPSLMRILKLDCCTGCGICAAVSGSSIKMRTSPAGFLRPEQCASVTAETDRLIADICPGIHLVQDSPEGVDHPLWGPLVALRTGASTDAALRHHASSGGALSALLLFLLESGTVDYVVEVAASEASPIENTIVESRSRNDIYHAAGSRYAPSAPLKDLELQLARPGRFALVGKPCDIAAVRALARHDRRVTDKIPVLLSFFCAGIPSFHGTREILSKLDIPEEDLTNFKYRGDGWPGYSTAKTKSGREASMSYNDSWGGILTKHIQFRCKICPDGSGGFADIVCGDAWYSDERGQPLFSEANGRSLIISRTAKGESVLQQAIRAGYLTTEQIDTGIIETMQPAQARRKRLVLSRLAAMATLGNWPPRFRGFQLGKAARTGSIFQNLRSFLGMVRRLILSTRHILN